jgi:hypothetical protein
MLPPLSAVPMVRRVSPPDAFAGAGVFAVFPPGSGPEPEHAARKTAVATAAADARLSNFIDFIPLS